MDLLASQPIAMIIAGIVVCTALIVCGADALDLAKSIFSGIFGGAGGQ